MNEAIGWALFHFLWEGAAVALLLAILLVFCKSAQVRYAVSCVALLTMLAAFAVTAAIKAPAMTSTAGVVHIPAGPLPAAPAGTTDIAPSTSSTMPYRWAVPLWLAGVALLSLHRLAGIAAMYRMRRSGACLAPAPWPVRLRGLASQLGVSRTVQLLESCLTEVPVTAGYLRPAILLPMGMLAGLPAEHVEYILIHELAHIARRDYLVNLLQSVVEALLFYHPAVWWVSSVIRAEREHCCDDAVVALAGDARGYAAALVTLEHARSMEPALAATGGSLTNRVRRLLQSPAPQSVAAPLAAAAFALAIAGVALAASETQQIPALPQVTLPHPPAPLLSKPRKQKPLLLAQAVATQPAQTIETPYRKWMNEDVAYIITNEERRAFKDLTTDDEREHFIQQFWLIRDPTPGTVENEFKLEHYRRIAYTNDHFSAEIPGWKTDRGRVYITYGPPDEIDDHSNVASTTVPFQQWRYKFIEGVGTNIIIEFVDPNRNGEYRMTSDPAEKLAKADALAQQGAFERIARFNQPPAAPAPSGKNVYVANEPGGRVSVHVTNHVAVISLPFSTTGNYLVQGHITTQGRPVNNFEDPHPPASNTAPTLYQKSMSLIPGSYSLSLSYKNSATGETRQETVNFFVY